MTPTQLPEILRGKINMDKYAGKPIDSQLITILCETCVFNGNVTYKATDTTGYNDKERVSFVTVYEGSQIIGGLGIETRYRRSEAEGVFVVKSEFIDKRRNNMSTKHLKLAMKAVKEFFKPLPMSDRARDLQASISNKMERMSRRAAEHVSGAMQKAAPEILAFLTKYDNLENKPAKLPDGIVLKLGRDWQTYVDNLRICQAVQHRFNCSYGACIRVEEDGTLSMWDMKTQDFSEHQSTYSLPAYYQEKITILKLMEEDQPVEHVGVKFSDYNYTHGIRRDMTYFFLIEGETYTTT